jgi:vacuolar protein sorting-associated protein 13A/C
LKQNVKRPSETKLVSIVFDKVTIDIMQYVESFKVQAALGDFSLIDGAKENTRYPKLISVKSQINSRKV